MVGEAGWLAIRWLHIVAMALFVGGQLVLGVAIVPVLRGSQRDALREIARRFGWASLAALGVLIATGSALADRDGRSGLRHAAGEARAGRSRHRPDRLAHASAGARNRGRRVPGLARGRLAGPGARSRPAAVRIGASSGKHGGAPLPGRRDLAADPRLKHSERAGMCPLVRWTWSPCFVRRSRLLCLACYAVPLLVLVARRSVVGPTVSAVRRHDDGGFTESLPGSLRIRRREGDGLLSNLALLVSRDDER